MNARIVALFGLLVACGRQPVIELTRPGAPGEPEADGGAKDAAAPVQCTSDLQCQGGANPCPGGGGVEFRCLGGACVAECVGTKCQNDCDCGSVGVSCGPNGTCANGFGPNECCDLIRECPASGVCVEPSGATVECGPPPPECANDCDCAGGRICELGACTFSSRPSRCCSDGCLPGETCEAPGGGTDVCPPVACRTDCDCPDFLACANGECFPLSSRRNECCGRGPCPPDGACVNPDGSESTCVEPFDGGTSACASSCECPLDQACILGECRPAPRNPCCALGQCRPGRPCERDDGTPGICPAPDASVDAGRDGGVDAGRDAGRDAGVDAGRDGGRDAGRDAELPEVGAGCASDCECDPLLACLGGTCLPAGRLNLCCTAFCPPGAVCQSPDGGTAICPSDPDAGSPDATAQCASDCDCAVPFAVCEAGACVAATSRPNECCTSPFCPPNQSCELPGGGTGVCGDVDAGVPDGGAPCATDCDCPAPFSVCTSAGTCGVGGRLNECCGGPFCPPSGTCVDPNGQRQSCAAPDGGVADGGPAPTDGGVLAPCGNDCDCDPRLRCAQGRCLPLGPNQCCGVGDCPPGDTCELPGGGAMMCPPALPVGDACDPNDPNADCAGGLCIEDSQGFPGGYCSDLCGANDPCPQGSSCRPVGGTEVCLDRCQRSRDCRAGYLCVRLGTTGSRVCFPEVPGSSNPNGAAVGEPCADDSACDQGLSCLDSWPGGYCTKYYCDPQTNPCPNAAECYAFPEGYSMCLDRCSRGGSQSDCRPGFFCLGPSGRPGVCVGR